MFCFCLCFLILLIIFFCRLIAMIAMEHLLLGFKIVMMYVIDDVPRWIREAIAQQHKIERQSLAKDRINKYACGGVNLSPSAGSNKQQKAGILRRGTALVRSFSGIPTAASGGSTGGGGGGGGGSSSVGGIGNASQTHKALVSPCSSNSFGDLDDISIVSGATDDTSHTSSFSQRLLHRLGGGKGHGHHGHSKKGGGGHKGSDPAKPLSISTTSDPRDHKHQHQHQHQQQHYQQQLPRGARDSPRTQGGAGGGVSFFPDGGGGGFGEEYVTIEQAVEEEEGEEAGGTGGAGAALKHKHSTAVERLATAAHQPYGFEPIHMMALIVLPAALHYLQITPWLYLPLAVLFFGCLQSHKERIDRTLAIGIVSDPSLLKVIMEEMPSWPTDSEFQQMVRA
jgi:hypothetical protein